MNDEREPNVCELMAGLESLRDAIVTDFSPIAAMRAVHSGLEKVKDISEFNATPQKIDRIKDLVAQGQANQALPLVENLLLAVGQKMPRFRIVLINETKLWTDLRLVKEAGEIWAAYLYDENRKVNMADIRASYEMKHLYDTSTNRLSDLRQEQLITDGGEGISMYCQDVDRISWAFKHFCGSPCDTGADDYQALEASEAEYYGANVCIDLPRSIDVPAVLQAVAQQLLGADDLCAIATLKMLAASVEIGEHKEAVLKMVNQYQRTSVAGDLLKDLENLKTNLLEVAEAEIQTSVQKTL